MIVGIGTDLLHIPRIKALIAKRGAPTLARRILSPRELTEFKALIRGKLDKAEAEQAEKNGNKDNVERTSFRTVLKGLNRNIENDAVTRFLASRWAAKEAAYKALYPLYVTPSSSPSSQPSSTSTSSASSSSSYTSNSSLKPFDVLPTRTPSSPSTTSSSSASRTPTPGTSDPSTPLTPNLNWKSVDLHYINSKPHLRYTYGYGQRNDLERDSHERKIRMPRLFVSLSHDGDYVSAVVIAEEEGGGSGSGGSGGSGKSGSGSGKGEKGGVVVTEYR